MAPRLKVFEWSDGFHRFTVAASSRSKALAAWGIQQDIFASGLAREAVETEDEAAARARPGTVIERGLAVDVGKIGSRRSRRPAPAGPSPTQTRRIEALADALQKLERSHAAACARLEEERCRIEVEGEAAEQRFNKEKAELVRKLEAAGKA